MVRAPLISRQRSENRNTRTPRVLATSARSHHVPASFRIRTVPQVVGRSLVGMGAWASDVGEWRAPERARKSPESECDDAFLSEVHPLNIAFGLHRSFPFDVGRNSTIVCRTWRLWRLSDPCCSFRVGKSGIAPFPAAIRGALYPNRPNSLLPAHPSGPALPRRRSPK